MNEINYHDRRAIQLRDESKKLKQMKDGIIPKTRDYNERVRKIRSEEILK